MEEEINLDIYSIFFLSHFIANSSVFEIDLFRQQFKENLLSSLSHFKLINACKYKCGFVELLSLFYTQAVSKRMIKSSSHRRCQGQLMIVHCKG